MRLSVIIIISLMLQACATTGTQPRLAIKKNTPLDASVQIYIPKYAQDEYFVVDYAYQEPLTISSGADLKSAAFDISHQYFTNVDSLSFGNPADFILKISGESSLSNEKWPLLTGTIQAEISTMDGKLIHQSTIKTTRKPGRLNEHIYYRVYATAVEEFLRTFFAENDGEIQAYMASHKPQPVKMATRVISQMLEVSSTGTGFFINASGNIITNHHVIEQCLAVTVYLNGKTIESKLIKSDKKKDVAVLATDHQSARYALFNDSIGGERLGEAVMTLGYPLHGVLSSSLNLTTGNISSLLGVKDDDNVYQISAPIQPGNSGGPVINQRGLVAGVVQSKLNALELSRFTGDLAQNVNFAIKSSQIKSFLRDNDIIFHTKSYASSTDKKIVDIAEHAKGFTVQVKCHG